MWQLSGYSSSNYTSRQAFVQITKKGLELCIPNLFLYLAIATTRFSRITVILIFPG